MSDFLFHNQLWRFITTAEVLALLCVLTFFAVIRFSRYGWVYSLRLAGLALIFAVSGYASTSALTRDLPPQDYNFYLALAYALTLLAFVVPWRAFERDSL